MQKIKEKRLLIIFGASGNLCQKKLLPVILEEKLYLNAQIVLYSRHPLSEVSVEYIEKEAAGKIVVQISNYSNRKRLLETLGNHQDPAIYLALPSKTHMSVLETLNSLKRHMSVYLEKPHFVSIDEVKMAEKFQNLSISLIDHFLLKKTLLLWKSFPQSKREKFLNLKGIQKVKLMALEKVTAEQRYSFDIDGIVRDMIISHLFALYKEILPNGNLESLRLKQEVAKAQYIDYEFEKSKTPTFSYFILESPQNFDIEFISGKALSEKTTQIEIKMTSGTLLFQFSPETEIIFNGQSIIDSKTLQKYSEDFSSLEGYNLLFHSIINRKKVPLFPIQTLLFGYNIEKQINELNTEMVYYKKGDSKKTVIEIGGNNKK